MELVDDESKITIDVLLLGNMADFEVIPDPETSSWISDLASGIYSVGSSNRDENDKTIGNFMRARDISYQFSNSNSIAQAMRAYPDVNWRYIMQQENANSGIPQIRFNGEYTWPLQEAGRLAAQ